MLYCKPYFCFEYFFMKNLVYLLPLIILLTSCSNNSKSSQSFCDTTCQTDSFKFVGDHKFHPTVVLGFKNCYPDTLEWQHYMMDFPKMIDMDAFLGQQVRVNKAAFDCFIKDTSYAWLTFNDCVTGRGYLLQLPFNKNGVIGKYTGALNDFDPKFSIDPDLRAYTDRGTIFVKNIKTGKEAAMSLKEAYDIDFNKIHEVVDTVNVTKTRIYVKLKKEGKEVPIEKSVEL